MLGGSKGEIAHGQTDAHPMRRAFGYAAYQQPFPEYSPQSIGLFFNAEKLSFRLFTVKPCRWFVVCSHGVIDTARGNPTFTVKKVLELAGSSP